MKTSFSCPSVFSPSKAAESIPAPKYLAAVLYGIAMLGLPAAYAGVPTNSIICSAPKATAGGTAHGLITADTPDANGIRMFAQGSTFSLSFVTAARSADQVVWAAQDHLGNVRGSGTFPVAAGTQTNTLSCKSSAGGYFAVTASLSTSGGTLPRAGTRPMGIASFGILPNVSAVLPAAVVTHHDQRRFGMQGFNGNAQALADLGVSQLIDDRELSAMEPNGPNTWTPSAPASSYWSNTVSRLVRLDGIPAWASPTGATTSSYAPTDLNYYQNYMARVGTDTEAIRQVFFPSQQNNYYQVTWEPDWQDSAANFVAMYAAVYKGLHSADPHAVVMGPTSPVPGAYCTVYCTANLLSTYASLGLANYIDGVTTHGYYAYPASAATPPEKYDTDPNPSNVAQALDQQMRALRAQMQSMKPNMRLWSTELGIRYDPGAAYGPNYPSANQLYAQAAVATRAHLIILGEGAQVTYFFFGADYPGDPGYGTFFDLDHSQGSFTATNLSPKPEAMAFAAMTRIIDGTQTLGRLNGLPPMVYGYAFQQLGGGKVITALWTHNNAVWPNSNGTYNPTYSTRYSLTVDAPGTSGYVESLDSMGNPTKLAYNNGVVQLQLTESPQYIVSSNANVMSANVTTPLGYTGQ